MPERPGQLDREELGERVLASLEAAGFGEGELYVKEGRARRFIGRLDDRAVSQSRELGWAVRAGNARGSFFYAAAGEPAPPPVWPKAGPGRLRLPEARGGERSSRPSKPVRPLATEGEAALFLAGLAEQLESELRGARLAASVLEDGSSVAEILSSRGVRCRVDRRAAALRVEAVRRSSGRTDRVVLSLAERSVGAFNASEIAARLAERLRLAASPPLARRRVADCLFAPEVAAALLAGCAPRLVGPEARQRGAEHRWGLEPLTIIDDGRTESLLLAAPWDGEGVATRRVVLVEEGRFRQPLLAWQQSEGEAQLVSGCTHRASWRDLPHVGPSHLSIEPGAAHSEADLVASVAGGFYWRDVLGPGRFDAAADRYILPVTGYALERGTAPVPVSRAVLTGSLTGAIEAIDAVGSDVRFTPGRSLFGSPALRIRGVEVVEPD